MFCSFTTHKPPRCGGTLSLYEASYLGMLGADFGGSLEFYDKEAETFLNWGNGKLLANQVQQSMETPLALEGAVSWSSNLHWSLPTWCYKHSGFAWFSQVGQQSSAICVSARAQKTWDKCWHVFIFIDSWWRDFGFKENLDSALKISWLKFFSGLWGVIFQPYSSKCRIGVTNHLFEDDFVGCNYLIIIVIYANCWALILWKMHAFQ